MAKAKPKEGQRYRYSGEAPLGTDQGALLAGTEVEVLAVVPAGDTGAYDDTDESVVIQWEAPGTVVTDQREEPYLRAEHILDAQGNPTGETTAVERKRVVPILGHGTVKRSMSIGLSGEKARTTSIGEVDLPAFADIFEEV